MPPLPPDWRKEFGPAALPRPAQEGSTSGSGITLSDVLLSPFEELLGLLNSRRSEPHAPRRFETMTEWVQSSLPAFAMPEDVRGSLMDHVI